MKNSSILVPVLALTIGGCAGANFDGFWGDVRGKPQAYTYRTVPVAERPAFPRACLVDDQPVAGYGQCVEQGIHCYQLDNGNWCAGAYSPFVISYRPQWPR